MWHVKALRVLAHMCDEKHLLMSRSDLSSVVRSTILEKGFLEKGFPFDEIAGLTSDVV